MTAQNNLPKQPQTLTADLSHRLGVLEGRPLDYQLIDSLALMTERADTILELLITHLNNGNDPELSPRTLSAALHAIQAELADMGSTIRAYCDMADAADKESAAIYQQPATIAQT